MTVRFVKSWNGYYEGQIVTSPNGGQSEATLIALGYAVADLDGPDNSPVPVFAQTNPLTGGVKYFNGASAQLCYSFPTFAPSILASLVAGSMAAQSGTTVTITATAHGVVGSAAKDGYRFYYPGSASIAAGWYGGFVWVDANTVRFTNPASQTVGSESVNGGLAFTSQVTVCSVTVTGGHIGANGECSLGFLRTNDTAAINKIIYQLFGGSTASGALVSTAGGSMVGEIGFRNILSESVQQGVVAAYGTSGVPSSRLTVDSSTDKTLAAVLQITTAGGWIALEQLDYRITHRE